MSDKAVAAMCLEVSPAASVWSVWDPWSMYLSGSIRDLHCIKQKPFKPETIQTIRTKYMKKEVLQLEKEEIKRVLKSTKKLEITITPFLTLNKNWNNLLI